MTYGPPELTQSIIDILRFFPNPVSPRDMAAVIYTSEEQDFSNQLGLLVNQVSLLASQLALQQEIVLTPEGTYKLPLYEGPRP